MRFIACVFFLILCISSVFSQDFIPKKWFVLDTVIITGNKITKRNIITRELVNQPGDSIENARISYLIERSKQNIFNTSLFNFVTVDTFTIGRKISLKIDVKERWYTFPIPLFDVIDRNFNTWWQTKDFRRVVYGMYLVRENFRGRKENITGKIQLGYTEQASISYNIPYLNKKQNTGMSFSFSYNRNHEIAYTSLKNVPLFFRDNDRYIRKEFGASISFNYRKGLFNSFSFSGNWYLGAINDTIPKIANDYYAGITSELQYLSISGSYRSDHRDFKWYPLNGYLFDLSLSKTGLNVLSNELVNNWYFSSSYKQYFKISSRFFAAGSLKGRYAIGKTQPYFFQRALGYRDIVRGYEYYVVDGESFGLVKANFKYMLVRTRVQQIPFMVLEKFKTFHYAIYLNLFSDWGYVYNRNKVFSMNNNLTNNYLGSMGVGVDFVTYYDNVIRFECALNRLNQFGFYIHLQAPI